LEIAVFRGKHDAPAGDQLPDVLGYIENRDLELFELARVHLFKIFAIIRPEGLATKRLDGGRRLRLLP